MRRALAPILLLVVAAVTATWWWYADRVESSLTHTPFRYGFELSNDSGQVIREAQLNVFAPADLPGRQHVVTLDASIPFEVSNDEFGNRTLTFTVDVLPPYGTKVVLIEGEVEILSPAESTELSSPGPFLVNESKIQVDDERIVARARQLRDQGGEVVSSILEFVHRHVRDTGYLMEDRGAVYALTEGRGDCTEYMSLYSALARANGIPTRNLAGFRVDPQGARLSSSAYHNWLEYYDGRRWILVDPQHKIMNASESEYLTFRILTDETQLSSTQRFFSVDKRLRVSIL